MRFDLATMTKRARPTGRRTKITLRPIEPTAVMAGDLFAAAYKPIIQAWSQAVQLIGTRYEAALPVRDASPLILYRQSAGQIADAFTPSLIHDAVFDLDAILAAIEGSLQQLVINITPRLREWAARSEQWHRGKWRAAVLAGTGIDPQTLLGASDVSETVQAFVSRNVALVRSVSDDTRAKISDIVLRGYGSRTPLRTVAKEMDEAVDLGRKRALRIAVDQNAKLAGGLDQARQEQAGIAQFEWKHSFKKHPRRIHVEHDGKVYRWDDLPLLDGRLDKPGDAPFCGCRARAVIDLS